MSSDTLRIAVDTGGTFTDCVWIDPRHGELRMVKVFSTPRDPSIAVAEAIGKTGAHCDVLLHGTTVGTNALLQRQGARVAFVTTKGFEDSIEIGRQARPQLYDFFFDAIRPLVPPELRFGVKERVDKDGNVLHAPGATELEELGERLRAANAEAVAISTLFSFANPENEQRIVKALAPLGIPLAVSSVTLPEFREYERASTIVVNAFLQPVMERYLRNLGERINARIFVMQSSGGLAALDQATREPVRTVLSGPAGGVAGAAAVARMSGFEKIIGFDMGGTSTDVCLVDGVPTTTNEADVDGLPVRVPMLDIHTVGAGGGSLARFDAAGALRVGPESAGADPGPICYGQGTQPTVTDANVLLGRLPADKFLGGEFTLNVARTRSLTAEFLRKSGSRLSVNAFADGIIRVVNATMEKAIRLVSTEKGHDPREFSLVAFGGAGALHACALAEALGIPRVIVPIMPGALSALGILMSDVTKDHSRTLLWEARHRLPTGRLENEVQKLQTLARSEFTKEGWQGQVRDAASLDLRYKGQGFEINVPFGPNSLFRFHAEHKKRYGYSHPEKPVEIVTARLRSRIESPRVKIERALPKEVMEGKGPIIDRSQLRSARGPAVITEYSATTYVPRGWKAVVDKIGNVVITRSRSA
jgi:N-methylhydantoinase A